jgi:methylenetetrahydrofolate reductase (NADPH)
LSSLSATDIAAAAEILPRGTSVYLPWPSSKDFDEDSLETLAAIRAAGFEAVPHLAARGIPSRQALLRYLERTVNELGVRRLMLVGGEQPQPRGPWASATELLASRVLEASGIHEVGVAGFPEGHPLLSSEAHFASLARKLELARDQGLGPEVITQFSFTPLRVTEYCAHLARTIPELPVYAGMAGPASETTLRRFARRCGVSASLRALSRLGVKAANGVAHTNPDKQLAAFAHYCAARGSANLIGIHLYSFGGFGEAASWMQSRFRPDFTTPAEPRLDESAPTA